MIGYIKETCLGPVLHIVSGLGPREVGFSLFGTVEGRNAEERNVMMRSEAVSYSLEELN